MTRHLITPAGGKVNLAAPRAAETLARMVVDLGTQLEQAEAENGRLSLELDRLRARLVEVRRARNSAQRQAKRLEGKLDGPHETIRNLKAELAAQTRRADTLAAALAEQHGGHVVAAVADAATSKRKRVPLTDTEVLRVFLADLNDRLTTEARRHANVAVQTGLRLAAREVHTFATNLTEQAGAA